jgi:hypothetical protein
LIGGKEEKEMEQITLDARERQAIDGEQLTKLISRCDSALGNPFFVAIAEATPSAIKADEYVVKSLGWPNSAGKQMRAAVNIHKRFSTATWADLVPRNFCPAFRMHEFSSHPALPNNILTAAAATFGGHVQEYKESWPLLLREFLIEGGTKDVSTVDHMFRQDAILHRHPSDEIDIPEKIFRKIKFNPDLYSHYKGTGTNPISFAINSGYPYSLCIQNPKLRVFGRLFGIGRNDKAFWKNELEDQDFPRFFKALEILERRTAEEGYDCIRVRVRYDLGPNHRVVNIGWLDFERVQAIDINLEAVLSIRFLVKKGGSIQYYGVRTPNLITIRRRRFKEGDRNFRHISFYDGFPLNTCQNTLNPLLQLASRMENEIYLKGNSFLPLDPILGARLLTDPPERLGDLFFQ